MMQASSGVYFDRRDNQWEQAISGKRGNRRRLIPLSRGDPICHLRRKTHRSGLEAALLRAGGSKWDVEYGVDHTLIRGREDMRSDRQICQCHY